MNQLYNTGITLYSLAARAASLRSAKVHKMIRGQRRALETLRRRLGSRPGYIWFHASSLGEFEQGRPLIERLRREHPEKPILLSFFSPSGFEVRKNYPFVDAVVYLPFDTPKRVRKFLDAARPSMAVFIKYEFWGNYLSNLKSRNIPTYIISSIFRPTQVFFKPWGGIFRNMLECFNRIYVQDEDSRRLLDSIGVKHVAVAGDTRFDRVTDIMNSTFDIESVRNFTSRGKFTLIAGSSWEADEDIYIPWLNAHRTSTQAIIAPHEFDAPRLKVLLDKFKGEAMLLSEYEKLSEKSTENIRAIIVDSFGKLSSIYRYGDIAYIGGGFGAGIHNINEAAVYGIPVVFGPKHEKFKEARDLVHNQGAFCIRNQEECNKVLNNLLDCTALRTEAGQIAGAYIKQNIGATDRIYNDIFVKEKNRNNTND